MSEDKKIIEGSGGKGGGGGHTPVEAADTLRSRALVRVVDLISEGEIVGLVTGDAQSIFFDDTPVKSDDGTFNFLNVQYTTREGLPTQTYIPGFASVETERVAGVPITASTSALRSVSSTAVDAVRVTIQWPNGMAEASTSNGDIKGSSVGIAIDVKLSSSGTFTNVLSTTVSGKAMSVYEKAWRVERPAGTTGFWDIRVRRTTADSTSTAIRNNFTWARYTELIDQKSTYANSAVVGIAADAQATGGNIPVRSYRIKGIKVQLPSNYNPVTRVYTGVWDGTFQAATFTDNPAWILYDLLLNTRYGMGEFIAASDVDKFSFYDAGVYNDALVSNGNGGTEPRFTFNGVIQSRDDAIKVLQAVASCMRSTLIYYGGLIRVNQDRPSSTLKTITNSDVVDGLFTYSGSSIIQRTTAVNVQFNDKNDKWLPRIISEDDTTGIARYGYNAIDVAAFGCTSEGQARRLGLWTLYTNLHQVEACIWKASFNNQELNIGDVVNISDSFYFSGANRLFRVTALSLEESNIVRVEAVQYDATKYATVDALPSNPGTGTPPDTTNEVDPVTSVIWTPVVVIGQDGSVQSRSLRVAWTKPIGGFPVGYNFKWRRDNDNYTQVTDQATESYTILNATDGIYEVVIIAFNAKGVFSPAVTSTYTYSTSSAIAGTATLAAPTNFFVKDTTTRIWSGSDLNLEWTNPPSNAPSSPTSPFVKDFELKIYTSLGGTLLRTSIIAGVPANSKAYFAYTYAMNVADGGPRRDLYCEVRCRDAQGLTSSAASGTFSNQAISSIPITTDNVFPAIGGYRVTYTYPTDFDFKGVLVWADTTATFTPTSANLRYNGTDSVVNITGVPEKTVWYFRIAPYDSFNNPPSLSGAGLNVFPPVGVNAIGPVSPAAISNAIPTGATLPATGTEGQLFFLTTDGLLYRYHNGSWTANLTFAQIDGSLSGAQQAAINLANLTGRITSTQITNGSISTPLLAAGAVQTANLAAGSVVAGTIAAGAITSDKIAANSINANNANIANLSANILTANTITGGMIQAGTISSTNIAARTITANQISTATIAADSAFVNALQVTSLMIQGDAVVVPRVAKYLAGQNISNPNFNGGFGSETVLFGGNGAPLIFPLHVQPKVLFVTFAASVSAPGGGSGASFNLRCELQCAGTPIANEFFVIGLANNSRPMSQTAAFTFDSPTFFGDRSDYYVRFFASLREGSGGYQLDSQIATVFAMSRT
jgi:hypothetical protein